MRSICPNDNIKIAERFIIYLFIFIVRKNMLMEAYSLGKEWGRSWRLILLIFRYLWRQKDKWWNVSVHVVGSDSMLSTFDLQVSLLQDWAQARQVRKRSALSDLREGETWRPISCSCRRFFYFWGPSPRFTRRCFFPPLFF